MRVRTRSLITRLEPMGLKTEVDDPPSGYPLAMFDTPTAEQQRVLDLVADVYLHHAEWPGWAWLAETLDNDGLDAADIVASMPNELTAGYGYVWGYRQPTPSPDTCIGLTIAGLSRVRKAGTVVNAFLNVLNALGIIRRGVQLDPFSVARPSATRQQVLGNSMPLPPQHDRLIYPLLVREPSTSRCVLTPHTAEWQRIEIGPEVRRFVGMDSVEDYLERLQVLLGPAPPETVREHHSPFTLPAAIDYLDVVWQLRFNLRLITPPGVERSALLAFPAGSADEADTRLSALAELLKCMQVPGVPGIGGHPLKRLAPFLESHLPAEAHPRVLQAVRTLNAARTLRAGAQHVGTRSETVEALGLLGLRFPVSDWSSAWEQIQVACADAFDAIRDELQAATEPDLSLGEEGASSSED
jgi:hypothetical protein